MLKHEEGDVSYIFHFVIFEIFQSGEASDLDLLDLVGGGVHLGDHYVIVIFVVFSELIPDGGELFAVTAPWGIWRQREGARSQRIFSG